MPCDYSKYPLTWFTEIRPRILARANNCCEFPGCGFANHSFVFSIKPANSPVIWLKEKPAIIQGYGTIKKTSFVRVVLTIAHLDHDESNHNVTDDRLRAYCQLHHLRHDAAEKARRKLTKAISDLLL